MHTTCRPEFSDSFDHFLKLFNVNYQHCFHHHFFILFSLLSFRYAVIRFHKSNFQQHSYIAFWRTFGSNTASSNLLSVSIEQEPSETDYAPRTSLFLGSEGRDHRSGGWGETDYLCLVPFPKLHLPMLSWTSFQEMLQPE